jgi:PKD repeat protein
MAGASYSLPASFNDPGALDGPWSYVVQWGDGMANATGSAAVPGPLALSHGYAAPGDYTIVVTVADRHGVQGTASTALTVSATPPPRANPAPSVSLSAPPPVVAGVLLGVQVAITDPGEPLGGQWQVRAQWPDGSVTTRGVAVTSGGTATTNLLGSYATPGVYPLTVTVTDAAGGIGSATTELVIARLVQIDYVQDLCYGDTKKCVTLEPRKPPPASYKVRILTAAGVTARLLRPETVTFGRNTPPDVPALGCGAYADTNGDRQGEIFCSFLLDAVRAEFGANPLDQFGVLNGRLRDGTPIQGRAWLPTPP